MAVTPAAAAAAPSSPKLPPPATQIGATPAPQPVSPPVVKDGGFRPSARAATLLDLSGARGAGPAERLPSSGDPFSGAVRPASSGDTMPSVYRARRGDTLPSIARKLGVPLSDLQRANPGVTRVRSGQLLQVPPRAPVAPPLPPEIQQHLSERLAGWPQGAPERAELERAFASPAFASLAADAQKRLASWVSGHNPISTAGRAELSRVLSQPGASAARLQELLTTQPGLPSVVAGLPVIAEPNRFPYTINGPTEVVNAFASGAAPASRFDVEIEGQTIPVYLSLAVEPKDGFRHSLEEVARGLAALPDSSRRLIDRVQVEGKRNPSDAYWAKVYNDPDFRSYMTAGANGVVDIYPTVWQQPQHAVDASLIHETGHILSGRTFGSWQTPDPRWQPWDAAAQRDGLSPSTYARASRTEDFSETLTLYQLSRGTPSEAEYRAMFPERFAALEAVLAAPVPTR